MSPQLRKIEPSPPPDRGGWIQTYTGRRYYPAWPDHRDVELVDIAHALSMLVRFGGHCSGFYSVAEHSVHVSHLVPYEHALQALMHDATEAYCIDVPRPLKRQLANYAEIEQRNREAICRRFGLALELPPEVKVADERVLLSEQEALMGRPPAGWHPEGRGLKKPDIRILALEPRGAKDLFLNRFRSLTK